MSGLLCRFVAAVMTTGIVVSGVIVTGQRHAAAQGAAGTTVRFTEISREAGVDFRHVNGASADKHLVETIGSGGLFFDYDNDGWIDIFLVDGGSVADPGVAQQARHRLFRNRRNGTFEDATARSGIRHREYGMGACAGDYDNDGWVDLYVTNFGPNVLYRNGGTGGFTDVTRAARVGSPLWSTGCAFADLDRDGDLDLFVTNYVAADPAHSPFCGNARLRVRFYCHPLNFEPLPNVVYRNDGKGIFSDVSAHPALARIGATASASSSPTSTTTSGRRCSSPTTACRISCSTAPEGGGSRRSHCAPAWPWRPTEPHVPAWAPMPATTTVTGSSTSS